MKTKDQFTVTVGTIFEDSHIPLSKWLLAITFLCSSKKGVSAHQIHRMLKVKYQTAWFMMHRVREAMNIAPKEPLGLVAPVEVDETYWGNKGKQAKGARSFHHQMKVVSLVERYGEKRSFHVADVSAKTLRPIMMRISANVTGDFGNVTDCRVGSGVAR